MSSDPAVKLATMSLKDSHTISHGPAANLDEWKAQLQSASGLPDTYTLTKTLVFKPKTPKSETAVLIVLVALEESSTSSGAISKALNVKDPRLAKTVDVQAALGVPAIDVSPLSISKDNATKVQVALDQRLVEFTSKIGVHSTTSSETVFTSGSDIKSYLESTGVKVTMIDFSLVAVQAASTAAPNRAPAPKKDKEQSKIADAELIGITVKKDVDFSNWYQQVLTKGDMLDYYDVSGCYILKPWSFYVWEQIQDYFNVRIKSIGVENCSFPMFVSSRVLEREKNHIEGFAPEVAWVTKAGQNDLDEPIAIRPTSETVMYPYYAKWIRSHRDLPLRLNQWNSVVRWEFKHPQPFLRTREFLWQEGHTAHLRYENADSEVMKILDWYSDIYSELLAVPTIKGKKTENEKFAGGLYTTTVEGYIPTTGRGIQGGTSHCLGQNFSKMFNIMVEDPENKSEEGKKLHVWQNSWGLSTRTIGVMVMIHGDDKGLVMPPPVARYQVVIVPCGITAKTTKEEKNKLLDDAESLAKDLVAAGIRAKADTRDTYSPGYKFNDWELRGVPLRLEYGPKDAQKKQVVGVRRDTAEKAPIAIEGLAASITKLLGTIHKDLYAKAKSSFDANIKMVKTWDEVTPALDAKNVILMPHCDGSECEDEVKERSKGRVDEDAPEDNKAPSMGAKSLCIPFEQPTGENAIKLGETKCPQCGKDAKHYTLFGRSY